MIQTQSIQQIKVDKVQYHTTRTCISMWLNRYPVSVICEIKSQINSHTSLYYNSLFHSNIMRLGTTKSFNNNYRVPQFKSLTQIIHKLLKLKKQNEINHLIHKIK
jgi:hypothetical protein